MSWTRKSKPNESSKKSSNSTPKFEPKPYQVSGIKWLLQKAYAGLFWDPGLGKTSTVLHAFKILKDKGLVDTLFIVAKRRIIYRVWPKEVDKWGLPFTYSIVHGNEAERIRALEVQADVYLINFEGLAWFCRAQKLWKKRFGKSMLCVDESTKLRHINTGRFKAFRYKLGFFKRRVILTGTPIPNGMMNLYGQMYVVDQGAALGPRVGMFRNMFFHPCGYGGYGWELNEGAEEQIYKRISKSILRADSKLLNLPPLIRVVRPVELGAKAGELYARVEKEFIAEWKGKIINATNSGVATNKLRQIANGAIYETPSIEDGTEKEKRRKVLHVHDDKLEELEELLEELNGKPALIAYEYIHDLDRIRAMLLANPQLRDRLPLRNGKPFVPFIGGGVKDREADELLDMWDNGELTLLLGHPESIAHGLNMQGPEACVVFFSLTWDLENFLQFIQRIWRQGQRYPVFLYLIIARRTVDERLVEVLDVKDFDQKKLLDGLMQYTMETDNNVQQTKNTTDTTKSFDKGKGQAGKGQAGKGQAGKGQAGKGQARKKKG